jgi:hypothetical protein
MKVVTRPLVSKDVVNAMLEMIFSNASEVTVSNALLYLLKVAEKMNADEEVDPYTYDEPSEPANRQTMNFETEEMFENFDRLVSIAPLINRQKYVPMCDYAVSHTDSHLLRFHICNVSKQQI